MTTLNEKNFEFLKLISEAALANPFDDKRDALDKKILKLATKHVKNTQTEAEQIAHEAQNILRSIIPAGGINTMAITEDARRVIEDAALFSIFHRYMHHFDHHIIKQNKTSGTNLTLPFAKEILDDLRPVARPDKIETIVGLFFQMRRAFFFISNNVGGHSEPVRKLRARLWQSIFSHDLRLYLRALHTQMESFSTLLVGETGVGKSQAAAALGRSAFIPFDAVSSRFDANFLDIYVTANIAEYPESLIESELFGHKKGSFTGALENYSGLLGQTHAHGVLFLDEIGELSLPVQVKLLRVLQERVYNPVGSHQACRFSGRLVSATHANLGSKINAGQFRSDLYYRLASDVIEIPTLRQRLDSSPEESMKLVERILQRLIGSNEPQTVKQVHQSVMGRVANDYPWPGNLREFEQSVRAALLHGESLHHVTLTSANTPSLHFSESTVRGHWDNVSWSADELLGHYARHAYEKLGSFERVAQRLKLDWRTVKKWVSPSKNDGQEMQ
jgi:transcriptional regulator with PAS, ATPase and Fis domain